MPISQSYPVHFLPSGLSDSLDQSNSFKGACQKLQNLIFDRTDTGAITARPAAVSVTTFPGFNTPGVISAGIVVGSRIYGMIGSARNAGKDEPFVYDIALNSFITVSGITSANTPTTPSTTGVWSPPTMDIIGTRIILTHPGFNAAGGYYIGWFDISGFTSNTLTATTTLGSPVLTVISSNPIAAGVQPGHTISGTGIPANSTVVSLTTTTITISANATANGAGIALTIAGGTTTAPLWGAGNINGGITFTSLPNCVAQFFNRAWYGVGNTGIFSDSLNATQVTNATQALTFGNSDPVIYLHGLPYTTTSSGILQSLIAFKSSSVWAVTGDAASSSQPLAQNEISDSVTGVMPRTIDTTPDGIVFMCSDGPRLIDHNGIVQWINKTAAPDIITPFSSATLPSRACGKYTNSVYRICLDTTIGGFSVTNDYWYDYTKIKWIGPQSFKYHIAFAYNGTFYLGRNDKPGILYKSDVVQSSGSLYTELGATYNFDMLSAYMPITGHMNMQQIVESTIELNTGSVNVTYNISAWDEAGNQSSTAVIQTGGAFAQWGSAVWGAFLWTASLKNSRPLQIKWSNPIVFNKLQFEISGICAQGLTMKNTFLRYEDAGYTAVY